MNHLATEAKSRESVRLCGYDGYEEEGNYFDLDTIIKKRTVVRMCLKVL